jgi:hypothetical protein
VIARRELLDGSRKEAISRRYGMSRWSNVIARVSLVVSITAVWTVLSASGLCAEEKSDTLIKQIHGAWSLASIYNEQDGKKVEQFGPNPRGFLSFTGGGRFSMILMSASLPKFASNNRMKGTSVENQAVVQGSVAYYGTYKVMNETQHTLSLHIEGSTFPNWDGADQTRSITVTGDGIKIVTPTATIGGTNYSVWKRFK